MAKEPLFDLIKKLSASEKRYFTIHTQKNSKKGTQEYLELFQLIDRLPKYNETQIVQQIQNPVFAKNISSGKNYLYKLLLKSLRAYHGDRRALFKVYQLLQDFYILMGKNLVEQAARRLHKAKKLANKYHFTLPYLELLFLDRSIIRSYGQKKSGALLEENQEETMRCLQQISAQVDISILYDKTFLAIRDKMHLKDSEGSIRQLLQEFSNKVSVSDFSFDSRMTYHLIWANYYLALKGELDDALLHMKNVLDLFGDHPHLTQEYPNRYINVVNNYLSIYSLKKDYSPFSKYIDRLQSIKTPNEFLEIRRFEITTSLQLMQWLGLRQYNTALKQLPPIIQGLKSYASKMQKAFQMNCAQGIALIYFHSHQYNTALDWVHQVVQESRQDIRQDLQRFCRMLEVMLHFELGNTEYVSSLARSILRLSIDTPDDEVYKEVVRALVRAGGVAERERGRVLAELRGRLGSRLQAAAGGEEVLWWLEGKGE